MPQTTLTPAHGPDFVSPASPDATAGDAASDELLPPPRRSRRALWIALSVITGVLLLGGAAAATTWALVDAHERALAARTVSGVQQDVIEAELSGLADVSQRIEEQGAAYREARSAWDSEQAQAAEWRAGTATPSVSAGNPGGGAMPGADPSGRAFLDSIGASQVQLVLDAGVDNCGYQAADDGPYTLVLGGCFDTRFPNSVFLAWEPGTEQGVWAIFVHEVMHWYQYHTYYAAFIAAERVGVSGDAYGTELEADASCRAVHLYGIPASQYANTSAPCSIEGWYDGWLLDHLAALGVPVTEPASEDYEVSEVVRP
ncbi:hypothetical protein [Microbacterium sp. 18062]|uniref:hypothetical protein n=1 Tax=Microbacterium sp. 18062 TaxID=2681410 RepID=UPI00135C2890|nr:hypothetical protein [Microbacterium sp. 18062]